jgi:hypothetical protein
MGTQNTAKLECPHCDFIQEVSMPMDACQFFYTCISCQKRLKPNPGDCCVFCSYANIPCPPKQRESFELTRGN